MRLDLSQNLRQEMRLKLAPQIIQSIEILQLPLLELSNRIDQELLENPLLEVAEPISEEMEGPEAPEGEATQGDDGDPVDASDDAEEVDELAEKLEVDPDPMAEEDYGAIADLILPEDMAPTTHRPTAAGEKDAKLAAIENSPAPDITLEEHLRRQIAYADPEPLLRAVCESIVANLDWRGYLVYPLEDLAAAIEDYDVSPEQAEEALHLVQQFEPPGVAARDIGECLLLQLDKRREEYDLLRRIIESHLDDIVKNRYPNVVKALGCSMAELKQAIEQIGRLNPIPGALFGEDTAPHVIPDLRVELVEGEYRVILEETALPSLRICSYYARRLQEKNLDPKTAQYLREKLQNARWLIDAIQQRRSTLFNITSAIVKAQKGFLDRGTMHLRPLKMQEIADDVGVHVSTVSRAIAGKYVQTPRGIYSLKRFFTGGLDTHDGGVESWEVVRQKLLNVIENEDKSNPMSDEQVADQLAAQGVEIARRTVSKYRKLLGIPSSRQRREY